MTDQEKEEQARLDDEQGTQMAMLLGSIMFFLVVLLAQLWAG